MQKSLKLAMGGAKDGSRSGRKIHPRRLGCPNKCFQSVLSDFGPVSTTTESPDALETAPWVGGWSGQRATSLGQWHSSPWQRFLMWADGWMGWGVGGRVELGPSGPRCTPCLSNGGLLNRNLRSFVALS